MPRSSRKSKKRKASFSKDSSEVFVLSPQLLQKLGINIENIQSPIPDSSSFIASSQDELFKKPRSTRRTNKTTEESSVMTTATLMKESVLLSPSFINPVEYQESIENIPVSSPKVNSPGNLPIMPTIEHQVNIPECSNISQKKDNPDLGTLAEPVVTKPDTIMVLEENDVGRNWMNEQPSLIPLKNDTSYILEQSCSDLHHHIETYIKENELFNDLPVVNKKKLIVPDEDKSLITLNDLNIDDDHLDEAYSSDCSNGNNTISHVSAEFNLEPLNVSNIREQKINILSEEVIDNSRLNKMISKSLSPNIKDKMIPVSVDTIMSFKRNGTKADKSPEPIKYSNNCQDQSQSANVSMDQVSTADESFLDNIITGVMKIDEIDINILEVSDADLITQNMSNNIYVNTPEDSESNKFESTSNILGGTDDHYHTKQNGDCPTNDLQCHQYVQKANVKDISKVIFEKSPQIESNPDIFIEFIDKYPEVKETILSKINENEYDSNIISQIEDYMNASHDIPLSEPNLPINDIIIINQQTEVNTIVTPNIMDTNQISTHSNIKDNNIIENEVKQNKQEIVIGDATLSGALCKNHIVVNDEVLQPSRPVIQMYTDAISHCKCNMNNAKTTHQGKNDASNGKKEKLNEIASYLKMFVENKGRRSSTINSNSRPENVSSQAVLKPKSCVHGVEKPGGSNNNETLQDDLKLTRDAKQEPRTYTRLKNTLKTIKPCASISNTIITHEKEIDISDDMMAETATDIYCLCGDYGALKVYDFEVKTYNHIHYWYNMSEEFNIVDLFSEVNYINYAKKNFNEFKYLSEISETNENVYDPICWVGWDHPNKTVDKNLLFGKVVDLDMPNVTQIVVLPDDAVEATNPKLNNPKNISLKSDQTKMVVEDNETALNTINKTTSDLEAVDDTDIDCKEIYQVIECSNAPDTVQADTSSTEVNEDNGVGADLNVLANIYQILDENSASQLQELAKQAGKEIEVVNVKQSALKTKSVEEETYNSELNKDDLIRTKKYNKKMRDAPEPESKLHDKIVLDVELKESKTNEGSNRRATINFNTDLSDSKSTIKSSTKASSDVGSESQLKEVKSPIAFGDRICSDENKDNFIISVKTKRVANKPKPDLHTREVKTTRKSTGNKSIKSVEPEIKANEIKSTRQTTRKSSKDNHEELKAIECKNISKLEGKEPINTNDKITNSKPISDVNPKLNVVQSETLTKTEKKASIRVKQVSQINNMTTLEELGLPELNVVRKSSRKRSSNIEPELTDKTGELSIRSKRQASGDIKPELKSKGGTKSENITNTNAVPYSKTNELKTKRQSRNTSKDIEITNIDAVVELKTNESMARRQSRNARTETVVKDIIISHTDAVHVEKTNYSTTRRQSRNARKNIEPDTDKITNSGAGDDPKTTTRINFSRDLIEMEITVDELKKALKKADQITNSESVQNLQTNAITTRIRSKNAKTNIRLEKGEEELNRVREADDKNINDIKSSDVSRRRSCQNSESSLARKQETPPSKSRSKRSKTVEVASFKPALSNMGPSQEYLQVKKTVKKYESKKEKERKASDGTAPDLVLDRTPSSGLKSHVSDDKITSNANISTADTTGENIEDVSQKPNLSTKKANKKATKRKRSAIKSIESDSSNTTSTSSNIEDDTSNTAPELDLGIEPTTSKIDERITHETQCGVCDVQVDGTWIDHIAEKHFYLAWKKGEPVLDLNNCGAMMAHLKSILLETKQLTCYRCGEIHKRKNPMIFLDHIKNCDKSESSDEEIALSQCKKPKIENKGDDTASQSKKSRTKTCGMCSQIVALNEWEAHVMFRHYNLAWAVGDPPTNLKDSNLICRLLNVYKAAGGLFKCNECGLTRASALGFYAHVVTCGKSEEEIEEHMETCEICNKSYLVVNRQPHMIWHTQQQIKKEAKERAALEPAVKVEVDELAVEGKRKAATKAISIIQKLKFEKDKELTCERCDFTTSTTEQLKSHKCVDAGSFVDHGDVSEDSLEFVSDHDDDEGSAVEGAIVESEDEKINRASRKPSKSEHVSKYERIPFEIDSKEADSYVKNASELFIKQYFSDDTLYEKWRNREYVVLNEREIVTYTPQVAESCKFAAGGKWTTLKRFGSVKQPVTALFVGGCPASMCWVPDRLSTSQSERHYLAIATHLGPDPPRYSTLKHYTSPGTLLQIWEFGHSPYTSLPKLSMCIATDRGTVWSMSWCPSGARDSASSDVARLLGFVAVACSDGNAYVYSVPHPNLVVNDTKNPVYIKLKPVAELRLYYDPEKEICQPSKIFWSMQKGHEVVGVGYSNGMVAFYDLCAESPLTRRREGDRDIFYPYFSQQVHWSCITGISMYPGCGAGGGVWAAGSGGGGRVAGAGSCGARHGSSTANDTPFLPLWPAALLLNDDSLTNEMDFTGIVRKLSAATAAAGCLHCSKLAQFSSPLLKTMYTHPVIKDMKKRPTLMIQMRRLQYDPKDRNRSKDKHKSAPLEPRTYEKAIEEYGVRIKFCKKGDRLTHEKEFHPGRFPLSEVTAMAFCPSPSHHNWLAVATHSGLIFFINTS